LDPLQRRYQIELPGIAAVGETRIEPREIKIAERVEAVVDGHHDDIAARREPRTVVDRVGDAAGRIGAAVEIDHDGPLRRFLDTRRPDVEEQAVVALREIAVAPLRAGGAETAERDAVVEQRNRRFEALGAA